MPTSHHKPYVSHDCIVGTVFSNPNKHFKLTLSPLNCHLLLCCPKLNIFTDYVFSILCLYFKILLGTEFLRLDAMNSKQQNSDEKYTSTAIFPVPKMNFSWELLKWIHSFQNYILEVSSRSFSSRIIFYLKYLYLQRGLENHCERFCG